MAACAALLVACGGESLQDLALSTSCAGDLSSAAALEKLNVARAQARSCGGVNFPAAAPLKWSTSLQAAALVHSTDMASHNFVSHTGSDGSTSAVRTTFSGYGPLTGENIGAGYTSMDAAMAAWLADASHCANIMSPLYKDYAIACVSNSNSQYRTYWTQSFGIRN